jgi:hypothetical protein
MKIVLPQRSQTTLPIPFKYKSSLGNCTAVYTPAQHKRCALPFSMLQQNWFPRWKRVQMSLESAMQLCYILPVQTNYPEQRQCKKCSIMGLLPYSTVATQSIVSSTKSCPINPYVSVVADLVTCEPCAVMLTASQLLDLELVYPLYLRTARNCFLCILASKDWRLGGLTAARRCMCRGCALGSKAALSTTSSKCADMCSKQRITSTCLQISNFI